MKDDSALPPALGRISASAADDADRTTFDWPRRTATTDAVLAEMGVQIGLLRRRRRRIRGTAGTLVALLIAGGIWHLNSPSRSPAGVSASAVVLLPARQVLPDGSVVLLRSDAGLAMDFSEGIRRVVLQKGEALFEVAKDPERPFVVQAGGLEVRAVGTAFAVNLKQAAVEVLVTHGRVAVEKPGAVMVPSSFHSQPGIDGNPAEPNQTLALVDAGHCVVVESALQSAPPQIVPVSGAEISRRLAWRIPRLQFSRTPLVEAVAMVNKYSPVRIVLDGAALEKVRLSGVIRADNIDALLQLLELDHGIKATQRGEQKIVLRKSL